MVPFALWTNLERIRHVGGARHAWQVAFQLGIGDPAVGEVLLLFQSGVRKIRNRRRLPRRPFRRGASGNVPYAVRPLRRDRASPGPSWPCSSPARCRSGWACRRACAGICATGRRGVWGLESARKPARAISQRQPPRPPLYVISRQFPLGLSHQGVISLNSSRWPNTSVARADAQANRPQSILPQWRALGALDELIRTIVL